MRFKPCIDIHDGQVKQIVGGDLTDDKSHDNFVSKKSAAYYAELYKEKKLPGGHIILLNPKGTKEYELDKIQALEALKTYPGGMQIGGGIDEENAEEFVSAGASHVIMTSRLFDGKIFDWNRLKKISEKIGREHIVVDTAHLLGQWPAAQSFGHPNRPLQFLACGLQFLAYFVVSLQKRVWLLCIFAAFFSFIPTIAAHSKKYKRCI